VLDRQHASGFWIIEHGISLAQHVGGQRSAVGADRHGIAADRHRAGVPLGSPECDEVHVRDHF